MGDYKDFIRLVYLAAPMDQLSAKPDVEYKFSMTAWRDRATKMLGGNKVKVINPCKTESTGFGTDRWIIDSDTIAIKRADAILVNYSQVFKEGITGEVVRGVGTTMEVKLAYDLGKIVVIYDENREFKEHSVWLREHCSYYSNTLEDAIDWIINMNNKTSYPDSLW